MNTSTILHVIRVCASILLFCFARTRTSNSNGLRDSWQALPACRTWLGTALRRAIAHITGAMGWNWPLNPHRLADTDWDAVCPNPILLMLLEAGHVSVVGGQYYRHTPQKHSVGEQLCGPKIAPSTCACSSFLLATIKANELTSSSKIARCCRRRYPRKSGWSACCTSTTNVRLSPNSDRASLDLPVREGPCNMSIL